MLGQFKVGDLVTIRDVSKADRLVKRRLLDLGITEGSKVLIKNIMPFGGPLMIEAFGQCIGLRRKEALRIEVERG